MSKEMSGRERGDELSCGEFGVVMSVKMFGREGECSGERGK